MTKVFERVLVVMFENQYRSYAMQDAFLKKLAAAGANMTNYFGCFHPSQTNYVASLAGEVCAVTNDEPPVTPLLQETLVDLLEAKNISWKAYMEGYPGEPWKPEWKVPNYAASEQPLNEYPNNDKQLARYFRKHNAFASFHSIQADQERWSKIVSDEQFWVDINHDNGSGLAEYNWFTPDIWNDGHYLYNTHIDTNPRTRLITQLSSWLEYVFLANIDSSDVQTGYVSNSPVLGLNLDIDLLISDPQAAWKQAKVPPGTLIVITFDEADFNATGYDTNYDGPNQIYTVLLGDMIEPGTVIDTPCNHYSLIKTVEKNFALGSLQKNDMGANWFRFLWDQTFQWSGPVDTQLSTHNELALACLGQQVYLVTDDAAGNLLLSSSNKGQWSEPLTTGLSTSGSIAMAALNESLWLVVTGAKGELQCSNYQPGSGWSPLNSLGELTTGSIAMSSYFDYSDNQQKLMLCWQTEQGFIRYSTYADSVWSRSNPVGQLTDGAMTLAQLGPSLFLVYKQRNTRKLCMTSFNVGPFNAFQAKAFNGSLAPENDTSLHQWSPADMPVGHFAGKLATSQNDYRTIGKPVMASIDGEMHLMHRGAYQDTPSAYTEYFGLTGIFTASNPLTNGDGTMQQAGWTLEQEYSAAQLDPDSPVAMVSSDGEFWFVWRVSGSQNVFCSRGGYAK